MKILVFCEQRESKLKSYCFEALTLAHQASGQNPANVAALVVGVTHLPPRLLVRNRRA